MRGRFKQPSNADIIKTQIDKRLAAHLFNKYTKTIEGSSFISKRQIANKSTNVWSFLSFHHQPINSIDGCIFSLWCTRPPCPLRFVGCYRHTVVWLQLYSSALTFWWDSFVVISLWSILRWPTTMKARWNYRDLASTCFLGWVGLFICQYRWCQLILKLDLAEGQADDEVWIHFCPTYE